MNIECQKTIGGNVVLTEGAYNDTAVAKLYGFYDDFLAATPALTDKMEYMLKEKEIDVIRNGGVNGGYIKKRDNLYN